MEAEGFQDQYVNKELGNPPDRTVCPEPVKLIVQEVSHQMLRDCPTVDAEQRGQFHERRAVAVPRHQIVDLAGAEKGLSHPK